jgi:hypothetical protein
MANGSFSIQVSGHAPARRDVALEIVNETTGETRQVKPFLDGSAMVRNLPPGAYQVKVLHPNVVGELVDMRRVRLFEGLPTRLRLPLPDELFRDTPVRETPDADLTPVHDAATAVRDQVSGLGARKPGDPIRSDDWNAVVGAVTDLANAVAELTRLVAPNGHDHPELAEKIDEVNGNVKRFSDQFGGQLARIQRTLQTLAMERELDDTLSQAGNIPIDVRARITESISLLKEHSDSDTLIWGARKKNAYLAIAQAVGDLRDAQPDPTALENNVQFQRVLAVATEEATTAAPRTVGGEIDRYERVNAKTSGALLYSAFRQ